ADGIKIPDHTRPSINARTRKRGRTFRNRPAMDIVVIRLAPIRCTSAFPVSHPILARVSIRLSHPATSTMEPKNGAIDALRSPPRRTRPDRPVGRYDRHRHAGRGAVLR